MALVIADRVKETTTTTGTSDLALGGAATGGFQTFSSGVGANNTCYYAISDGTNWEVGLGTVDGAGTTLARTTVYASSAGTSKVSLVAGVKDVFLTYPAEKAVTFDNLPTTLVVTNRAGSQVDVPLSGGELAVLNRAGATIYVPIAA